MSPKLLWKSREWSWGKPKSCSHNKKNTASSTKCTEQVLNTERAGSSKSLPYSMPFHARIPILKDIYHEEGRKVGSSCFSSEGYILLSFNMWLKQNTVNGHETVLQTSSFCESTLVRACSFFFYYKIVRDYKEHIKNMKFCIIKSRTSQVEV